MAAYWLFTRRNGELSEIRRGERSLFRIWNLKGKRPPENYEAAPVVCSYVVIRRPQ